MTLLELQDVLGNRIEEVLKHQYASATERKIQMDITAQVSNLAKQMINNADIILRTNKLQSQVNLTDSEIQHLIK